MNMSLQNLLKLILLIALIGTSLGVQAQQEVAFKEVTVIWNSSASSDVNSIKIPLQNYNNPLLEIIDEATHGTTNVLFGVYNDIDTLVYTPDTDYTGLDYVTVENRATNPPSGVFLTHTYITINIVPSILEAVHDYGITNSGQSIDIEVLDNDRSNIRDLGMGDPVLHSIPNVNDGTAEILTDEPGYIRFTPEPGFSGMADVNYVAIDEAGTSATGTVTICVNDGDISTDILYLATTANTPKAIPMPFLVTAIDTDPDSDATVTVHPSGYAVTYTSDVIGDEQFTVTGENDEERTIAVKTVSEGSNQNSPVANDLTYTLVNTPVTINVFENDLDQNPSNFNVHTYDYGTATYDNNGNVTFTPKLDATGNLKFWYTIGPYSESARVDVIIDENNFIPSHNNYTFVTAPGVDKEIRYDLPIDGYTLRYIQGSESAMDGAVENGSDGRSVIYKPFVDEGNPASGMTDVFEVEYCPLVGNCKTVGISVYVDGDLSTDCVSDCVWPGDTDNNGIVDMADLFPLGLEMGDLGNSRSDADISWGPKATTAWNDPFAITAVDKSYHDANGNGQLSADDKTAIDQNYGKTHQIIPNYASPDKGVSLTAEFVNPPGLYHPEDTISINIFIGDDDDPELDLYGYFYPFKYEKSQIDESTIAVTFHDDAWTQFNAPSLSLVKPVATAPEAEGRLDIGFTRTDGQSVTGYNGPILTLGFIITEDMFILRPKNDILRTSIEIGDAVAVDGQGNRHRIAGTEIVIPISLSDVVDDVVPTDVLVSPNPASSNVQLYLNGGHLLEAISLYNSNGQLLHTLDASEQRSAILDVSSLPVGLYMARLQTTGGVVTKKIEVIR